MIYLDVTRLVRRLSAGLKPTGVDRVNLAYVLRYHKSARAVFIERGFCAIQDEKQSSQTFAGLIEQSIPKRMLMKTFAQECLNRFSPRKAEPGVLLHTSHAGLESARLYMYLRRQQIKFVCMVHDLIPLTHSEYCRPKVDRLHQKRIHTALRYADGLIANSHDTAQAIQVEADVAGLEMPRNIVAHLASGVIAQGIYARPIASPYFVMLGTIEPRKNHWFMLHIWRRIVETHGERAPKLVIIGRRGWECENVIDMLERCSPLRGHVIERTHCSDNELHAWMQHAQALLFPSFVEGYGMPLVEALAMRLPVIASDLAVFHEIGRDVPDYIDPLDGPGWITHILNYADDHSPRRQAQHERMSDFQPPTWAEHFARVDRFLESLVIL